MTKEEYEEDNYGRCEQCGELCYAADPSAYMIPARDRNGQCTGYGCTKCTDKFHQEYPNIDRRDLPIP